jgi:hypothetical protein
VGLPLEIIPLATPGTGPVLHARVLWNGKPLSGALVNAWRAPFGSNGLPTDAATRDTLGVDWQGRTDARGEVFVPVAAAGEWLVSLVHMVPCAARDEADWESTWASLTFERTAEGTLGDGVGCSSLLDGHFLQHPDVCWAARPDQSRHPPASAGNYRTHLTRRDKQVIEPRRPGVTVPNTDAELPREPSPAAIQLMVPPVISARGLVWVPGFGNNPRAR